MFTDERDDLQSCTVASSTGVWTNVRPLSLRTQLQALRARDAYVV